MTLKEALLALVNDPVLINDGADYWTAYNLLDELSEEDLEKQVYSSDTNIATLDDQGHHVNPPMYIIEHLGELPYYVERRVEDYQVRLMINESKDHSRPIYGQHRFSLKQAAYRRKSQLNVDWQDFRILGA